MNSWLIGLMRLGYKDGICCLSGSNYWPSWIIKVGSWGNIVVDVILWWAIMVDQIRGIASAWLIPREDHLGPFSFFLARHPFLEPELSPTFSLLLLWHFHQFS